MEKSKKTILVIDDHFIFREGLTSVFRFTPDFEVVGGASSVFDGIKTALQLKPEIILMDFSLPDGTGLDATRAILPELPNCQIIFLTVYETDDKLFAALRLGAKGYMLKSVASGDLIASLRGLEREEMAISRKMISRVVDEFSRLRPIVSDTDELRSHLTHREIQILSELESGTTNLDIAQSMFLSENTVKHHLRNIFEKLGVENRQQAAEMARKFGLKKKFGSK